MRLDQKSTEMQSGVELWLTNCFDFIHGWLVVTDKGEDGVVVIPEEKPSLRLIVQVVKEWLKSLTCSIIEPFSIQASGIWETRKICLVKFPKGRDSKQSKIKEMKLASRQWQTYGRHVSKAIPIWQHRLLRHIQSYGFSVVVIFACLDFCTTSTHDMNTHSIISNFETSHTPICKFDVKDFDFCLLFLFVDNSAL